VLLVKFNALAAHESLLVFDIAIVTVVLQLGARVFFAIKVDRSIGSYHNSMHGIPFGLSRRFIAFYVIIALFCHYFWLLIYELSCDK
jgi:hypothetical protein